jgi:WD40 repeat protein
VGPEGAASLIGHDRKVFLWDFGDGTLTKRAALNPMLHTDRDRGTHNYPSIGSFHADSREFLVGQSATLWAWPFAEKGRAEKVVLTASRGPIDHLAVSPDGRRWAMEDQEDGSSLRVWDVQGGTVREKWSSKVEGIQDLQFTPDGQTLASLERFAPRLTLWDATSGRKLRDVPLQWYAHGLDWAPDGRHLVVAGNGPLYIYRFAEPGQQGGK